MQRAPLFAGTAFVAAVLLAACGGGGGGTPSSGTLPTTAPTSSPTTAPTTAPTTSPTTAATNPPSMPTTSTVSGQTVYVGQNGHTLYQLSSDGTNSSTCTSASGCTGVWPPYAAPTGTTAPAGTPFSVFMRSDGTLQWAANGHPLYEYVGDTASGTANGQGIVSFGGTWTEEMPAAATSSPPPTTAPYATHRP